MWARLSVFVGGFELDAVEGVCADDRLAAEDLLGLLAALADKSVLIAEHGGSGAARYRLPETLREFGQERLQHAGEETVLRRRHRDWYEQLAARADTDWLSPQMAAGRPGCSVSTPTCTRPRTSARPSRVRPRPGCASRRRRIPPPLVLRVYAMGAGVAAWRRGDLGRAADLVQQSLRLRDRLNQRMGAAYCMEALAWIAASGRRYERAAVLLGAAAAAASLLRSQGTTLDSNQPMAGFQRDCERQARQALGQMAFRAAYHRGLQLPAEDALAYALQQPDKPPNQPPTSAVFAAPGLTAPEPPTPLTSRNCRWPG